MVDTYGKVLSHPLEKLYFIFFSSLYQFSNPKESDIDLLLKQLSLPKISKEHLDLTEKPFTVERVEKGIE